MTYPSRTPRAVRWRQHAASQVRLLETYMRRHGFNVPPITDHKAMRDWRRMARHTLYTFGGIKPKYPLPAIAEMDALHMRYPRVLSVQDFTNANAYFWNAFHRQYD